MLTVEEVARMAHHVNQAYCQAIGDPIPPCWYNLTQPTREGVMNAVMALMAVNKPSPEELHKVWMDSKTEQGWRHGPVKDEAKKEHPNMVPWGLLPPVQKAKDYIFRAVVEQLTGIC